MILHANSSLKKVYLLLLIFTIASSSLLFAQAQPNATDDKANAGLKSSNDQGFIFSYPGDWIFIDMGGDDFNGTTAYTKALSPPAEENFNMVIMIFPKFNYDLKENKISYEDFMKIVFQSVLKEGNQDNLTIEKADAKLGHGQVSAFMAVDEAKKTGFRAHMICGDLLNGSAAMIIISMDLPGDSVEKGKTYLTQAENIMTSFTFPK
jgi:hypothetical protein